MLSASLEQNGIHADWESLHHNGRHSSFDVAIIGGGILGCAAAVALGRQGRHVLLVERDWAEPDRIVGELLQPGGVNALKELGLLDTLKNMDAVQVDGYVVFQNSNDSVHLPYASQAPRGQSFHHGKFVTNLRAAARAAKGVTCVEATVRELVIKGPRVTGVQISFKGSFDQVHELHASLTIVADGCFSKFRKAVISKPIVAKSSFVGLVLKDVQLPRPQHGHVILADPSPILLYQIGTHDTRILVDIPGTLPSAGNGSLKNYLASFVGPQLPKTIQSSFYEALENDRIRSMPNSWLPPSIISKEGLMVLGDALNMRHPLTGGGMTVALWDVVHLERGLRDIKDLGDGQRVMRLSREMFWTRKSSSMVINILANALYALFSAGDDENLKWLQKACFGYFKLGGRCAATPVGLLAGLIQEPFTLIGHFFAVAFYATWLILTSRSIFLLPLSMWRAVMVLWTATAVIGPLILAELRG